ncbi:MAG TPA: septation protein IspZ [Phenylobacterium sp.]|nr:septation protein IspZ [Phenylobacterium sp.]
MRNLFFAGRALAQDLLPTIVFAILVALHLDVVTATLASVLVSVTQIALQLLQRRPVGPLQWASLGLVLVFGAAGILTHDARFLMAKPTLIYVIVGAMMLKRGWMLRYMPPSAEGYGERYMIAFGYAWAGLLFLTGAANLVFAIGFPAQWPAFLAIFPTASKITLFAIQYVTVRALILRDVRAEMAAQAVQAPVQAAA